jgi:hypothetical protein
MYGPIDDARREAGGRLAEEVSDLVGIGVDSIIIAWLDAENGRRGEVGDVVGHVSREATFACGAI